MTASVLKQDPNTKRFEGTLIYFDTDTQYANVRGNPLYQAIKWHINSLIKGQKSVRLNLFVFGSRFQLFERFDEVVPLFSTIVMFLVNGHFSFLYEIGHLLTPF